MKSFQELPDYRELRKLWKQEPIERPVPDLELARTDVEENDPSAVWNQLPDDLAQDPERSVSEPLQFEEPAAVRPEAEPLPEPEIAIVTPLPTVSAAAERVRPRTACLDAAYAET